MSAVRVLAEARHAGVELRVEADGRVRLKPGNALPGLLAALRAHKGEVVELLQGKRCRRCGEPIEDRGVRAWIPFVDGTAAHDDCEGRWYAEDRLRRARQMFS